jgi:Glycoside-hydrolase family GH114
MARSDDNAEAGPCSVRGRRLPAQVMRLALVSSAACLVSCGGDSQPPPVVDGDVGPAWWQPKVGEAKNWDIQLGAPIDVSEPRTMYDLDLWALVPSPTMIDYGDGDPVAVPAGALAGTIAQLHARTPPTIVICHLDTGALDLSLPDARKFRGYKADPTQIPDNPDAMPAPAVAGKPEDGSVIGWRLGAPARRWLDITEASRSKWIDIMFKRFDLAAQIGCDGVDPGFNQAAEFMSGFSPGGLESISWYAEVAKQGHARGLSTGMKNGYTLSGQTDAEADKFDWLMVERCGEENNCDFTRPFINLQKAVFAIDYDHVELCPDPPAPCPPLPPQSSDVVCPQQKTQNQVTLDGIYKDVALTSKVRTQCNP